MKNTPENKAKFFAKYWGQIVAMETKHEKRLSINASVVLSTDVIEDYRLLLTPVSVFQDQQRKIAEEYLRVNKKSPTLSEILLKRFDRIDGYALCQSLIDQGYYVGDGSEIEYGWVKLKNEIENDNQKRR